MRDKAQQDDFNVKLMQSLDKIKKKMDKEIEMSRSRSRRSRDEKRREEEVLVSILLGKRTVV